MADPLTLLREYNITKKTIIEEDGQIIFGNISWPKNTKTNYIAYSTNNDRRNYYTLECLVNILKYVSLPHPSYVKKVASAGIPVVCRPDRKDLLLYLNGTRNTSPFIDKAIPLAPPTRIKRAPLEQFKSTVSKKPRLEKNTTEKVTVENGSQVKDTSVTSSSGIKSKSLTEVLSAENIESLKAKRLAKKRSTIKCTDFPSTVEKSEDKEISNVDTQKILDRERHSRNRVNILQTRTRDFSGILKMLIGIEIRERGKEIEKPVVPIIPSTTPSAIPSTSRSSGPYNRYDQERYTSTAKQVAEGFQIDTRGTLLGSTLPTISNSTPRTQPATPAMPALPEPTVQAKDLPSNPYIGRVSRTPIIIIPSATSLITMYNAKQILEELRFVTQDEIKASKILKKDVLLIQRRKKDVTVPYWIIDNPTKLTPADWDRVVAVFAMGPAWQFKNWPWNGNPVEIFSNICAFHLKYDNTVIDKNIAGWDVNVMNLSQYKRHQDKALFLSFWDKLEQFMTQHKRHLRF